MKKTAKAFVCSCLMLALLLPFNAFAKQEKKPQTKTINAPTLQSIEFNNARLDGEFLPTEFYYELIVENGAPTPTLKNYEVSKGAEIFVTYNKVDGENGINVEVKNDTLSANYFFEFEYENFEIKRSSNNNLMQLDCELGYVYPDLNNELTTYQLYIPSDLTELRLTAVPEDLGATCDIPHSIKMTTEQNPVIDATVIASDSTVKVYSFEVKRLELTSNELQDALHDSTYEELIKGEVFHYSPEFRVIVCCAFGGIIVLAIGIAILKRVAVKAQDDDEVEFFDSTEEEELDGE